MPFTTGILIGIGETREERLEALEAIAAAGPQVQEVIVQNFRAKPGTRMVDAPEPPLEELLWTIAVARLILPPEVALQAPPNLTEDFAAAARRRDRRLGRRLAGHDRPRQPRGAVAGARAAPRRDREPRPRARAAPDRLSGAHRRRVDRRRRAPARAARRRLARPRPRGRLGARRDRRDPVRRPPRPAPAAVAATSSARRRSSACSAPAARSASACSPPPTRVRREVNGDEVTYVVTRNIQYTNVCYFRCGFCAFSKGKLAANLRGEPYLVPHEEIVRRAVEAWDRGATEVCLQGGIHPSFDGDYYASVVRAIKDAVPDLHVHAFSALEVWQGAATLGVPLATTWSGCATRGSPRCPAPRPRCSTTRCAPSSAPTRSRPRSGSRCTGPRTRSASARTTRSCSATSTARATGPGTCSRCASSSARPAASPSSCRSRSCTWRRRST